MYSVLLVAYQQIERVMVHNMDTDFRLWKVLHWFLKYWLLEEFYVWGVYNFLNVNASGWSIWCLPWTRKLPGCFFVYNFFFFFLLENVNQVQVQACWILVFRASRAQDSTFGDFCLNIKGHCAQTELEKEDENRNRVEGHELGTHMSIICGETQ
jgi:hypothetical protein